MLANLFPAAVFLCFSFRSLGACGFWSIEIPTSDNNFMANLAALVGCVLNAGTSSSLDRYNLSHSRQQFANPLVCLKPVILRKRTFWLTEDISSMNLSRSKWNTMSKNLLSCPCWSTTLVFITVESPNSYGWDFSPRSHSRSDSPWF